MIMVHDLGKSLHEFQVLHVHYLHILCITLDQVYQYMNA